MGKVLVFLSFLFNSINANAGSCFFNYSKIQCVKSIENKTYQFDCPQGNQIAKCETLSENYFDQKKRAIAQSKKQNQQQNSSSGSSNTNSGSNSASNSVSAIGTATSNYASIDNGGEQKSENVGSANQQEQVKSGQEVANNKSAGSAGTTSGANAKDPQAAASQYFQETELAMNSCENSWHSLFTNNCSTTGSTILNGMSSAGTGDAGNGMNANANAAQATGTTAAAGLSGAKGACNANLLSCGGLCKQVRVQAEKDNSVCSTEGANSHATSMCSQFANTNSYPECIASHKEIFVTECQATAEKYTTGAVSSVRKCYAAGAAFLAVIAGGIMAINKYKKNAKALKNEVEYSDEVNADAVGTSNQQEEIIWNNGRHEVVSSNKSASTSSANESTMSLGASGSTSNAQTNSRKIADPNPNSDLNFKGYDPNQEYTESASSAGSNKLGTNNNTAAATGQKIMGVQQAAGATATAVSGSLGAGVGLGGSGASGGSNSANSELAAYMPGGARDPAAAVNAAQVRAYNEARKQIRYAHSPSNFKAVQSAYDREKNRMGINSLGVGN